MINQDECTSEQSAAVIAAMAEYLTPRRTEDGEDFSPIVPGEVRRSRGGTPWVAFGPAIEGIVRRWFRYRDIPAGDDYSGGLLVHDADRRPLGNNQGPLILHMIRDRWLAQPINTGWNYETEIIWS